MAQKPNIIWSSGPKALKSESLLKGSWDLVSMVISTLIGVISSYKLGNPGNA